MGGNPEWTRLPARGPAGGRVRDHTLERPGAVLHARVVHADRADALLYVGGTDEHVGAWGERFGEHVPHRATYLLDHRGCGDSSGEPAHELFVGDAIAAYDDLRTRHGRVAVVGRSLGSGVAVQVAAARDVDRLVLVTPFDSLAAVVRSHLPVPLPRLVRDRLPVQWLMPETFDSAARAHLVAAPTLVLRAGRDQMVHPARTDRLLAALPDAVVVDFADDDHGSLSDHEAYWTAIGDFLR